MSPHLDPEWDDYEHLQAQFEAAGAEDPDSELDLERSAERSDEADIDRLETLIYSPKAKSKAQLKAQLTPDTDTKLSDDQFPRTPQTWDGNAEAPRVNASSSQQLDRILDMA